MDLNNLAAYLASRRKTLGTLGQEPDSNQPETATPLNTDIQPLPQDLKDIATNSLLKSAGTSRPAYMNDPDETARQVRMAQELYEGKTGIPFSENNQSDLDRAQLAQSMQRFPKLRSIWSK